jgi:flagellar basal body-associated protein FliL
MTRFLTARLLLHLFAGTMLAFAAGAAKAADPPPQQAQHKTTQSESYVIIDPLYSSILDGAKPRGLLMIELGLDVPEANFRERVSAALPVLRDAYVRSMTIYAATAVRVWRQPNVADIANRLQAITDRIMGRSGARVLMAQTAIRLTR